MKKQNDQKSIETIYASILNENVLNPDSEKEFEVVINSIFKKIPSWVSRSVLHIIRQNGIFKIQDTYDYLGDFIREHDMKRTDDQILIDTIESFKVAREFIRNKFLTKQ